MLVPTSLTTRNDMTARILSTVFVWFCCLGFALYALIAVRLLFLPAADTQGSTQMFMTPYWGAHAFMSGFFSYKYFRRISQRDYDRELPLISSLLFLFFAAFLVMVGMTPIRYLFYPNGPDPVDFWVRVITVPIVIILLGNLTALGYRIIQKVKYAYNKRLHATR